MTSTGQLAVDLINLGGSKTLRKLGWQQFPLHEFIGKATSIQ